jgi:hypothetical protein
MSAVKLYVEKWRIRYVQQLWLHLTYAISWSYYFVLTSFLSALGWHLGCLIANAIKVEPLTMWLLGSCLSALVVTFYTSSTNDSKGSPAKAWDFSYVGAHVVSRLLTAALSSSFTYEPTMLWLGKTLAVSVLGYIVKVITQVQLERYNVTWNKVEVALRVADLVHRFVV